MNRSIKHEPSPNAIAASCVAQPHHAKPGAPPQLARACWATHGTHLGALVELRLEVGVGLAQPLPAAATAKRRLPNRVRAPQHFEWPRCSDGSTEAASPGAWRARMRALIKMGYGSLFRATNSTAALPFGMIGLPCDTGTCALIACTTSTTARVNDKLPLPRMLGR